MIGILSEGQSGGNRLKGRDGAPSAVKPLFIAQMAAWVRLLTSILRSRVFRWTLTVASVMPSLVGDQLVAGAGHQQPAGSHARAATGRGPSAAGRPRSCRAAWRRGWSGTPSRPAGSSWSDWISASGDTVLIRKPSAPPPIAARSTSTDRSSASTTIRAVGKASRRARRSASSFTGWPLMTRSARFGSLCGGQGQVDRVELSADFEAGTGQQMLQSFAEQPVGFDQDGAGRGHGGLPPKALMIERPRDPGW